jgi:hypothetical protein
MEHGRYRPLTPAEVAAFFEQGFHALPSILTRGPGRTRGVHALHAR